MRTTSPPLTSTPKSADRKPRPQACSTGHPGPGAQVSAPASAARCGAVRVAGLRAGGCVVRAPGPPPHTARLSRTGVCRLPPPYFPGPNHFQPGWLCGSVRGLPPPLRANSLHSGRVSVGWEGSKDAYSSLPRRALPALPPLFIFPFRDAPRRRREGGGLRGAASSSPPPVSALQPQPLSPLLHTALSPRLFLFIFPFSSSPLCPLSRIRRSPGARGHCRVWWATSASSLSLFFPSAAPRAGRLHEPETLDALGLPGRAAPPPRRPWPLAPGSAGPQAPVHRCSLGRDPEHAACP